MFPDRAIRAAAAAAARFKARPFPIGVCSKDGIIAAILRYVAWRAPIAEKIAETLEEKWVDYIARQKPGCVSTIPSDLINSTVSPLTREANSFPRCATESGYPIVSRCDDAPNSIRDILEEKEKNGKNIVNVRDVK